eukprot:gene4824-5892_t
MGLYDVVLSMFCHKTAEKEAPPALVSYRTLFQYATWFDVLLLFMGSLASAVVGLAQPASIVLFADIMDTAGGAVDSDTQDTFDGIVIKFILLGAISGICGWTYAACFKVSGFRQAAMWRKHYFKAILRQDIGWYDTSNSNELPSKISETTHTVEEGVSSKLGEGVRFFFQGFGGLVTSLVFMWDLGLIMLCASPLPMFGAWLLQNTLKTSAQTVQDAYNEAGCVVTESLANIRTIASLQAENTVLQKYDGLLGTAEAAGVTKSRKVGFASGLLFASSNIMVSFGFLYGGWKLIQELQDTEDQEGNNCASGTDNTCDVKGSTILIAMFSMNVGAQGLGLLEPCLSAMTNARQSAKRILDTVDRKPVIDIWDTSLKTVANIMGEIIFEAVEFAYPSRPDAMVCNGFDLTIQAGQTAALVGQSGCGKSTGIQLIERFYDPLKGRVLLDGVDLRELKVQWLRQKYEACHGTLLIQHFLQASRS